MWVLERERGFLVMRGGGKYAQCLGTVEGGGPLPPLSPVALQRTGLTPGSVFCSCRALWAFRAESRAQYVRKAHPEEGQEQRDRVDGECLVSPPKGPPTPHPKETKG
jgi:hypothetical protein